MKKLFSGVICLLLAFTLCVTVSADASLSAMTADTAVFLLDSVKEPKIGSVGGEWTILGLSRSGASIPNGYFDAYYANVEKEVKQKKGVLHERKYTEYSRVILALTAIGKDPTNVAGYDLTSPLKDVNKTLKQGLNGPIWALIALDSGAYASAEVREQYLQKILDREIAGGGWALSEAETDPEPDITAMALTALSRHLDRKDVSAAVDRGLSVLSAMQLENGGFSNYGVVNAESAAQALVALSSLSVPYTDDRFVKGGRTLVDVLQDFYLPKNGFSHTLAPLASNLMATEQCYYALVAAERLSREQSSLFAILDAEGLPGKHPDVRRTVVAESTKAFSDITNSDKAEAIEALARRGIVNGMTENRFCPNDTMTRAQFAAIVVRSLGLPLNNASVFDDVRPRDWYFSYIATAFRYGIIKGVSEKSFSPDGTITREEAAVMVARAAKLCGLSVNAATLDTLSSCRDANTVSSWALSSVAFCYRESILDAAGRTIKPREAVTREEIASMLYRLLGKARLL